MIRNLSCQIQAGDRVAIVGQSGIGKSTLLKLILQRYSPTQGRILINSKTSLSDLDQSAWYNKIAYLGQSPSILEGTVHENIAFELMPNQEDMHTILALSGVDVFCPQERILDTSVAQGGGNFSGGEKQRIALARALIKQADILLLDEATSALDSGMEQQIIAGIEGYMREHPQMMLFAVSHRPEIVRLCNKVIEFYGDGEVVCRIV